MRNLNIAFEDGEYEELLEKKGDRSWRTFILEECLDEEEQAI